MTDNAPQPQAATTTLTEVARAKVNLTLHVTGQRADGYHLLDSLVVFAQAGDVLTLTRGPLSLRFSGRFGRLLRADPDNLCLRAARLAGADMAITLDKCLPVAAGIGGGSADAAAVLRGAARLGFAGATAALTGGNPGADQAANPGADLGAALGADLPVCVSAPRPARMRGMGEVLDPVPPVPPLPMLLVNPGVTVQTPSVFRALTRRDNDPMPDLPAQWDKAGLIAFCAACRNDLQAPALALVPEIGTVLAALDHAGADLARMSGSGATCFGLFHDEAAMTRAAGVIAAAHPGWWVCPTRIALADPGTAR
ncbi:4-(cytidine 5'-diphospho)-2-C-methyl-D-erythritol kinase [Paracoccus jiaweipingae]|uniref:4-(cytidine 5'-diphospho)-2-C-methyl-D-erythritol kinase n=1 Tax=unclassified Paracoccus (in: a-proteobacteria) TaxID=2688777 RepID=UPI003799A796